MRTWTKRRAAEGLRQRHFNWFLRLAEESDLEGEEQRKWIDAFARRP